MRFRQAEHDLPSLLARIEAATEPKDIVAAILEHACPRLRAAGRSDGLVERLFAAEAFVDLGFWLIAWELPDWVVHRLSCDDTGWNCAISVRGLAINWVEDVAEFQHSNHALAILGLLVQAQLRKRQGPTPSNVTPFRRVERPDGRSREP